MLLRNVCAAPGGSQGEERRPGPRSTCPRARCSQPGRGERQGAASLRPFTRGRGRGGAAGVCRALEANAHRHSESAAPSVLPVRSFHLRGMT